MEKSKIKNKSSIKMTNIQKLVIVIISLVFFILAISLLKIILKKDTTKHIDYANMNAAKFINESKIETDKGIYWSLNEIVGTYINSYLNVEKIDKKRKSYVDYKQYYKILTKNYKEFLGKKEYYKLSEEFMNKFVVESVLVSGDKPFKTMDNSRVLKEVYLYSEKENMYICKLKSDMVNKEAYIGIALDPKELDWYIFFLE